MKSEEHTIGSWNRFLTRNLVIHPEIVSAVHEFQFEDHQIRIALPPSKHLPAEPGHGDLYTFNWYKEADGKKIPQQLGVESVDVTVSIAKKVLLPPEITKHSPNRTDIVSKEQQKKLNELAAAHGAIAERVFDLWVRTLRWKSENSEIGRPMISGYESGWSTYLITEPKGERIWIAPMIFVAKKSKMVTSEIWKAVASALKTNQNPPVFVDLVMDAEEHLKRGDLQRATVEMAMGCEVFLRKLVAESLPSGLQPSVAAYVDDANIRPVLEKFVQDFLNSEEHDQLKRIKSKLHQLFDLRNSIVHKGQAAALSLGVCEQFLEVSKKLVNLRG